MPDTYPVGSNTPIIDMYGPPFARLEYAQNTCLLTAFWGLGLWLVPPAANAKAWVHEVFYFTGTLSWGLMARRAPRMD